MKKLDELGISPAPWKVGCDNYPASGILARNGLRIDKFMNVADARLISVAPELYKCLHEAVIEMCHNHACCGSAPEYKCNGVDGDCFVKRWRLALARAAGKVIEGGAE